MSLEISLWSSTHYSEITSGQGVNYQLWQYRLWKSTMSTTQPSDFFFFPHFAGVELLSKRHESRYLCAFEPKSLQRASGLQIFVELFLPLLTYKYYNHICFLVYNKYPAFRFFLCFAGVELLSQRHESRHLCTFEPKSLQWASGLQIGLWWLLESLSHAFYHDTFCTWGSALSYRRKHWQPLFHRGGFSWGHTRWWGGRYPG